MKLKEFQEKARSLSFDQEAFIENDEKVLFYTGLSNWNLLLTLFQFVQLSIASLNYSSLSPFKLLLLTLTRLHLSTVWQRFRVPVWNSSKHCILDILRCVKCAVQ